jgi:hypothetical protein
MGLGIVRCVEGVDVVAEAVSDVDGEGCEGSVAVVAD